MGLIWFKWVNWWTSKNGYGLLGPKQEHGFPFSWLNSLRCSYYRSRTSNLTKLDALEDQRTPSSPGAGLMTKFTVTGIRDHRLNWEVWFSRSVWLDRRIEAQNFSCIVTSPGSISDLIIRSNFEYELCYARVVHAHILSVNFDYDLEIP